ncbi:hypothetical protein ACVR05_08085 [Streptococcus caprae]|uniref:Uncharacterized protein n=1 Tax=Streptococcus caprae TaxID=1640501 RepID=A0ABV8CTR8_9STRE
MDIYSSIGSYLSGDMDLREIRRDLEKQMILLYYAPVIKMSKKTAKEKHTKAIDSLGKTAHADLLGFLGQLDSTIKGKSSDVIKGSVEGYSKIFDDL